MNMPDNIPVGDPLEGIADNENTMSATLKELADLEDLWERAIGSPEHTKLPTIEMILTTARLAGIEIGGLKGKPVPEIIKYISNEAAAKLGRLQV